MRIHYPVVVAALAGCASASHQPAPLPVGTAGISLRAGWDAVVVVDRVDSIILTLPTGERQFQHFERRARFSLAVDSNHRLTLRLDSLRVEPKPNDSAGKPVNASWTAKVGDTSVEALRVTSGGDRADELAGMVAYILPRIPQGGLRLHSTWTDSGSGTVRVDIFSANEHRNGEWVASAVTPRDGVRVIPLRLRETFEQLGDGNEGGMKITMTAQGRRSGTYYVTQDGRLLLAEVSDSISMLISVPSRKEVVPTTRISRSTIRFLPVAHAP